MPPNILKPALARGELQCIGATTLDEYRKYIERDAALQRRFQESDRSRSQASRRPWRSLRVFRERTRLAASIDQVRWLYRALKRSGDIAAGHLGGGFEGLSVMVRRWSLRRSVREYP